MRPVTPNVVPVSVPCDTLGLKVTDEKVVPPDTPAENSYGVVIIICAATTDVVMANNNIMYVLKFI
jgi:hypothetical protein